MRQDLDRQVYSGHVQAEAPKFHGEAVEEYATVNMFRYGNGATKTSTVAVLLPVAIGGRIFVIDAAVIEGQAPLLLGRPTLEKLKVQLNFQEKTLQLLDAPAPLPMKTNSAGQLLLDVMAFPVPSPGARDIGIGVPNT